MKILDIQVQGRVGIISVEYRKGKYINRTAYRVLPENAGAFTLDHLKQRVYSDAQKFIEDKQFEEKNFRSLEDFVGLSFELD